MERNSVSATNPLGYINKRWGVSSDGQLMMGMGGLDFSATTGLSSIAKPANAFAAQPELPPRLSELEALMHMPAAVAAASGVIFLAAACTCQLQSHTHLLSHCVGFVLLGVGSQLTATPHGAEVPFIVNVLDTDAVCTIHWGTQDTLTFPLSWDSSSILPFCMEGNNTASLGGLLSETVYYYRALLENGEGKWWTTEAAEFRTADGQSVSHRCLRYLCLSGQRHPNRVLCGCNRTPRSGPVHSK